ncbi:hypothetical protein MD588_10255 [Photobacterium sp. SDRW27]|uniref:hypothetical protein n=1 Tax=Photobacterium obscurum TaxID=2829490 RepID=UPI0022437184|nr:hypothetical protein [Photobacterium obscurum]MCW8329188.1 hypothetical protein [Photobacterium obscurum]
MKTGNFNLLFLALSAAGLLFGGYFAVEEWFVGPSFATNDGLVWTLPLVTYIFLALASTGISFLLTCGELLNNESIKTHKTLLLITALSLLIGAFAALATELGSLFHLFWLVLTPNLKSPIWWMGTLYAIELVLLGIKFYALLIKRTFSFERWLTAGTLCVAVAASLVLGSVFGTVVGRVGFYGVDASILTFLCALASGMSLAPLLLSPDKRAVLLLPGRLVLGALALLLLVNYIYLARGSIPAEQPWVSLWMPLLLLVALITYQTKPAISTIVALPTLLLVELAFVIQGQQHVLGPKQTWLGMMQSYQPNLAEVGILVFGCSVAYLCFFILKLLMARFEAQISSAR